MKLNILIGIILLCCGCSLNKDIIGKYASNKNSDSFEFKKDSTFNYEYRAFHLLQHSEGKWTKLTKDKIIITSDIKCNVVPLDVKEMASSNLKSTNALSIYINIENGKNLSEYTCGIFINDVFYDAVRCDSVSYLPISTQMKNCYFYIEEEPDYKISTAISPPVYSSKYYIKTEESNYLNVTINFNESLFFYQSFDNSVIKIKRKSIQFYHEKAKKWVKIPKVSQEANIFSSFRNTPK